MAGGHGTRLWPITKDRAKPLLPLGENKVIDYILDDIPDKAEIFILTNKRFAEDFEDYSRGTETDFKLVTENQEREEQKPGTIGGILHFLKQHDIDDDLLIVAGDNYFGFDLAEFIEFSKDRDVSVAAKKVSWSQAPHFGILRTKNNVVQEFVEKPEDPESRKASTACYHISKNRIKSFLEYKQYVEEKGLNKEKYLDSPGRFIEWLVDRNEVSVFEFSEEWFDVGTPKTYIQANVSVMDGSVVNGETQNSNVENSLVMGDATVKNSEVVNSIVFEGSKIKDSSMDQTIIDEQVVIENKDLNDSLVGRNSVLK